MVKKRHSGLGKRGVNVLISSKQKSDAHVNEWRVEKLPIDQVISSQYQPRQHFDEQALQELADSIKAQGLVQPIIVKWLDNQRYELIAGERRWRAAQMAGLETLPAIVREVDDKQTLAMALIENIQREDLNPLEEARSLQRLMQEFELTQQEVAEAVGRSRTAVTNLLRLLKLPELIQEWLHEDMLSMGHVRALLTLNEAEQIKLAQKAIDQAWSVRQMEQAVQTQQSPSASSVKTSIPVDPNIQVLQNRLADKLGAKVMINHGAKGSGKLEIRYSNLDELDQILQRIEH
ncbi:MAG: ParB/RepB/Spo0J family partition protein [Thiomicrospira sp.]|uniref:ParB/RepB/Spo0J family partition protein n=1 Tax=Thiomicrospira sp. TaxID=935 RepID=UPI001A04A239|nr:ParB/RepB/Spo0J family partition protein [Thiomicrospira sp.]MBE0493497.1 ParB/RepB/Spo0J family partition protein [Thiomicrospira sp.]